MTLKELEPKLRGVNPIIPIRLSQCEVVTNHENFINNHISFLKANSGNERYKPYFKRLINYYEKARNTH